jgi:anti-sigma B factor antagonist
MEILSKQVLDVMVVEFNGELTAQTAGPTQEGVLRLAEPLPQPGAKLILDMTRVSFMSSAGLRLLLIVYRAFSSRGGKILLVGLSEDLQSTMSLTGFLDLFRHEATLEAGLSQLALLAETS